MGAANKTMEVRVIFKAIDDTNRNACHFITFEEVSTRERVYLQVGVGNYMMIVEGDRGELCYKEHKKRYKSKFIFFERAINFKMEKSFGVEDASSVEVVSSIEETH